MADPDEVSQLTRTSAMRTESGSGPRHILSVDYGTTYTGVAWILTSGDANNPSGIEQIHTIENWGGRNEPKVPSKITYTAIQGRTERWGYGVGDSPYVLKETKLDLEKPRRIEALEDLLRTIAVLDYMSVREHNVLAEDIPRHVTKTPLEIVTDYLCHIAAAVRRNILAGPAHGLGQFPVDLIFTHPVEWDKQGMNLTFRAVMSSFGKEFPEIAQTNGKIYMASESEACAQYTMRDSQEAAIGSLAKGDCFIVVDAGGGTVDLAAYLVKEVEPFRVKLATNPTGRRCGAALIDDEFMNGFLPCRLSVAEIEQLRFSGGSDDRFGGAAHKSLRRGQEQVLSEFIHLKHTFEGPLDNGNHPGPSWINLPRGVGTPDERMLIRAGQLGITCQNMMDMFEVSLRGTRELIEGQVRMLDGLQLPARAIFFSGGLSRNKYALKELTALAGVLGLDPFSGSDSWTAVAKGAALMAMDVGCGPLLQPNIPCPFHIGVVLSTRYTSYDHDLRQKYTDTFDGVNRAKDHIQWVVARGDLVTMEGIKERVKITRKFSPHGSLNGQINVVVSRYEGPQNPPSKFTVNDDESRTTYSLNYTLASITPDKRRRCPSAYVEVHNESGPSYCQVQLELEIQVSQRSSQAEVRLIWGRTGDHGGWPLSKTQYIPF
ncbi:Heat shock 70 kDa protein 12B [Madurella fahalii]|uniref:Heat shock 70 kDa protein 12B n=1 Tax=Madurella fahalii TaxID=1157608 RepID=A0ABQ0GST4_9PEZI